MSEVFRECLKPVEQVSECSVILSEEGQITCCTGNWKASEEETKRIIKNKLIFICKTTNIYYGNVLFWTERIDNNTAMAQSKDTNERLIIKSANKTQNLNKIVYICAVYIEGKNDYGTVLAAVNRAVADLENPKPKIFNNPINPKRLTCKNCGKEFDVNDGIKITPSLFICNKCNDEDKNEADLAVEIKKDMIDNFVQDTFCDSKDDLLTAFQNEDLDGLISEDTLEGSVQRKPYEDCIPSITLHFDKDRKDIDYDQLMELLGDDAVIINSERGSTIVVIALLSAIGSPQGAEKELKKYVENLKANSTLKSGVFGNFDDSKVKLNIPSNGLFSKFFNRPSYNQLQVPIPLKDEEIKKLQEQIVEKLKKDKEHANWKFIFSKEELFEEMEEQLRKSIEENQYEMIITGQTLIANKYYDKLLEIKNKIPNQDCKEDFLYHGTRLENHSLIIENQFLNPAEDKMKKVTDDGYYGKGIYATNNLYYALMYSNGYNRLKVDDKAYILCCRTIYNTNYQNDLHSLDQRAKQIDDETKANFGINHAFVGSSREFLPIDKSQINSCDIYADEYVFPYKSQIVPFSSFTVMRKDHYILWKDENIKNEENSELCKELKKTLEINVYAKKSNEEALDVIRTKKFAYFKLITNGGGKRESGKQLIERARLITGSKFVCLVYAQDTAHMDWISKMENVLFTTEQKVVKQFASLTMTKKDVLNFIKKLKAPPNYNFNINEEELLNFGDSRIIPEKKKDGLLEKITSIFKKNE